MSKQSEHLAAALSPRYRLDQEIGRGGMATVYLAHDFRHGRKVAVKVLRPELSAALGGARFLKEIRVTANLQHPNILPLYDSGEAESLLYYVMPYIEGESLRARLDREGRLGVEETVRIAESVAAALEFAHVRGIVHRDIKPENILLLAGQALVADFGVALAVREAGGTRLTDSGISVGTPRYMSPEQARGDIDIDARSDIYALGAVVYEMLVGDPPIAGSNLQAVLARLLTEDPTPVHRLRPGVSRTLDEAVMRALAKVPGDRFDTMTEFAAALTRSAGEGLTDARPAGARRRLPGFVIAGVAVTAVAGVLLLPDGDPGVRIESLAVLPFSYVSRDTVRDVVVEGMHDALNNELSKIIPVISTRSVMRFRDSELPSSEIAAALGVNGLVNGSVLRVGDDIRINVELVEAATDRNMWTKSYQGDLSNVLTLQRDLTRDIADEIALTLTAEQRAHLSDTSEVDPLAFELYYRGRDEWNRRTGDGLRSAVEYFDRALDIEPGHARAWAGLSDAYNMLGQYRHLPVEEARANARRAADRAIALDPTLAAAYTARAEIHFLEREWEQADEMYRQAIASNQNYAIAHHFYGWFLSHLGRDEEAIATLERAMALDPLSAAIGTDLAAAYFHARRYDEAEVRIRQTLEVDPEFSGARWVRFLIAFARGTAHSLYPPDGPVTGHRDPLMLAHILSGTGRRSEADSIVRTYVEASDGGDLDPYSCSWISVTRLAMGETDLALEWLERAVNRGLAAGPHSLHGPLFDPVRSDPRFIDIMEAMEWPEG